MNKGMQYLPHAGQRDRDKWTNLIERDFIGTKVITLLRNQPNLLPPAQLSLFRKPLLSNNHM